MIKISVVVPVYKTGEKLNRCIDSILNQTFADFELILVDDGSPDNSGLICDEYAARDSRIVVIHKENGGVSVARNTGIKIANGDYIVFVDSDDYVDINYLSELYKGIMHYQTDFCMCNYISVFEDGQTLSDHGFLSNRAMNKEEIKSVVFDHIFRNYSTDGLFSPWGKIFKRKIITENNLSMDTDMSFGEDMLFVVAYLERCDCVVFIENALYYYERQENGLFRSYRKSLLSNALQCYRVLKVKTAPSDVTDEQYLPLTLKYHYYLAWYIKMGIQAEKNKTAFVRSILSDSDVLNIYDRIAKFSDVLIKDYGWTNYELRVPKLVYKRRFRLATRYLIYQNDENCFLRKIKRILVK